MEISAQPRVMLWTLPRSHASTFVNWIGHHQSAEGEQNVQVVINPYTTAHDVGPEKAKHPDIVSKDIIDKWIQLHEDPNGNDQSSLNEECSFNFAKELLERDFNDKAMVFCKDLSYGISGRFDKLPSGYTHSFLIRNPYKTLLSWRNSMQRCLESEKAPFDILVADALYPALEGYKKSWELLEHLQVQGEKVVVVDIDDIQQDPGVILRMYCQQVGIPFQESRPNWGVRSELMTRDWIVGRSLLKDDEIIIDESESFVRSQPAPKRHDIPFDILQYIDASMPYYLKMHNMRIMIPIPLSPVSSPR